MSDDDDSYDPYGDTDPNNVPDGGAGQDTTAGDGLPGYPVDGLPGVRAGVFGSGRGLLGMARESDLVARPGDGAPATLQFGTDQGFAERGDGRLLLASDMPSAYMPDGHGGVQLRPDFAATHPKGPFDFGAMAHNIDWGGAGKDLLDIAGGVAKSFAGDEIGIPTWFDLLDTSKEALDAQNEANKPGNKPPKGADRATNGSP